MEFLRFIDPTLIQKALRIAGISLLAIIAIQLLRRSIALFFDKITPPSRSVSYINRVATIRTIIQSIAAAGILLLVIFQIASDLGFNIMPLVTGAGIIGIAISFGSQTLVKDIISGFFVIMDNQINIGDTVKIADTKGKVVNILMRTIVLEDDTGNIVYIPNSEVKKIVVFKEKPKKI